LPVARLRFPRLSIIGEKCGLISRADPELLETAEAVNRVVLPEDYASEPPDQQRRAAMHFGIIAAAVRIISVRGYTIRH
jgi:hypothetical protein